jgi:hypothetical protein
MKGRHKCAQKEGLLFVTCLLDFKHKCDRQTLNYSQHRYGLFSPFFCRKQDQSCNKNSSLPCENNAKFSTDGLELLYQNWLTVWTNGQCLLQKLSIVAYHCIFCNNNNIIIITQTNVRQFDTAQSSPWSVYSYVESSNTQHMPYISKFLAE